MKAGVTRRQHLGAEWAVSSTQRAIQRRPVELPTSSPMWTCRSPYTRQHSRQTPHPSAGSLCLFHKYKAANEREQLSWGATRFEVSGGLNAK
jgi:hypothetical protein